MKKIEVEISAEGKVQIKTSGFKGAECLEATKSLEKALGEVEERTSTKEMNEKATVTTGAKI